MDDEGARLPRRIALAGVDAGGTGAVGCLLADFAEALPVYARLAGMAAPELAHARCDRDVAGCDTVLIGLMLGAGAPDAGELPLSYAEPGTRVYALVCTEGEPGFAAQELEALAERCGARGLRWMGGLAVGDAAVLPRVAGRARMGWARRRVSEAVDRLIAAVRAGLPAVDELARPSRWARAVARRR